MSILQSIQEHAMGNLSLKGREFPLPSLSISWLNRVLLKACSISILSLISSKSRRRFIISLLLLILAIPSFTHASATLDIDGNGTTVEIKDAIRALQSVAGVG